MREAWENFQQMLDNIEQRNYKVRNDLYNETMKNLDEFNKEAGDVKV